MRRSEITQELIELSKKAKELGFPQDVEEGDWVCMGGTIILLIIGGDPNLRTKYASHRLENGFLILSFSRCLEWLEKNYQHHMILSIDKECSGKDEKWWFWFDEYHKTQQYDSGETHHEAIAKAVVKILEEK